MNHRSIQATNREQNDWFERATANLNSDRPTSMEKTKIAYVINQYPKVRHTFIRREIAALEREGFEVIRIALRGWNDDEIIDPEDLRERARTKYVLEGGIAPLLVATFMTAFRDPARFATALRVALQFMRRSDRPALLHLAYLAEACRLLPWLEHNCVSHIHAHFATNSAEVALFAHLISGLGYSFTMHGSEEFDKPTFIRLAEKIRHATFVVAVSSFTRSQLFRWVDETHWPKIKVIHCGLDRDFLATSPPVVDNCKRLVYVGSLSHGKGLMLLLNAASLLVRGGLRFELVLAGGGEMRTRLENSIATLGLSSIVRITGWLTNDQVKKEILDARALVMPSFAEGLPVVIIEAMALERPVLATYIGGIPEVVQHGEDGWLFPAGSIEDLAAAMRECLEAPISETARRGRHARDRALARHSIDKEIKLLSDLFRKAVSERNARAQPR